MKPVARKSRNVRIAGRPASRSGPWMFVAIFAFVIFCMSYFLTLSSLYPFLHESANGQLKFIGGAATALVAFVVMVVCFKIAKATPAPVTAEAQLQDWSWNEAAKFHDVAPTSALEFARSPLVGLEVVSSGPAAVKAVPDETGITVLDASLPGAGGARVAIGTSLAWAVVEGKLPALTLARANVDPRVLDAIEARELDVSEHDFIFEWRVYGSAADFAAVLTPDFEEFLNSTGDDGVVVHFEQHRVVVWSDHASSAKRLERLRRIAVDTVHALPDHLVDGGKPDSESDQIDPKELDEQRRRASLGSLSEVSSVRKRVALSWFAWGLLALISIFALVPYVVGGVPLRGDGDGLVATAIVIAIAAVTSALAQVFLVAKRRVDARHLAVALQVRDVAKAAGLVFSPRARELEQEWTRRPFSTLKNLGAAPSASAPRDWGTVGVAYIEGDIGSAWFLVKTFQSRVAWAHVGAGLPRVAFLREGFASRAAKLIGGSELDTESYAFNKLWRVKTDHPQEAHAMLQPLMIDFLTAAAEDGIAIHLDGDRVVIWDDGTDKTIDLAARLALVERFVNCLPSHLRPAVSPDVDVR